MHSVCKVCGKIFHDEAEALKHLELWPALRKSVAEDDE